MDNNKRLSSETMNNIKLKETQGIENLKLSINGLIEEYKQAYTLLNDQMQAVINHDISSLNGLVEKQVATYETLKESENKFKRELQTYQLSSNGGQKPSLGLILENLNRPSKTLNTLRNQLHAQVEKTEKMRTQLVELLQFAQQQNAEIFKALCTVGSENTEGYNVDGKKQQQQASGMAINQKA